MSTVAEADIPTGLVFVDEPAAPTHLNIMAYGAPGAGKSTFAASSPGPILWVNADGPNALAYARKTARAANTPIFEVRVEPGQDVRQTLRDVLVHVKEHRIPEVETVVVDPIGRVREALIAQIVVPGAKNTMQQFGEVAKVLRDFIRFLRDQPVNLVILAHEDVEDADGDRIIRPLIGGALTETVPADMDVMAYCGPHRDGNDVEYLGQLVEGRGRRAKDRSGGLGTVRKLDVSEWITAYRAALSEDIPWEQPDGIEDDPQLEIGDPV
jgi:AAA domain